MRDGLNLDYSLLIPEYILGGSWRSLIIAVDLFLPKANKKVAACHRAGVGSSLPSACRWPTSTRRTTSPA